ncbi:hypothetical protein GQ53DRAFT_771277 [Thozetella sp. PMI_491]|nr:hypothetical protein GQ53DRAFT_771277 [Thozetella sp. PMI_491]
MADRRSPAWAYVPFGSGACMGRILVRSHAHWSDGRGSSFSKHSAAAMFARSKSKEPGSSRKVTPPSPTYMNNDQFAAYLADLRNNRISRPGGARPPPPSTRRESTRSSIGGRSSLGGTPALSETSSVHQRNDSGDSAVAKFPKPASRPSLAASVSSRYSTISQGRDYYPERPVQPLKPSEVVPSATYIERGQRWMEKEEAFSLRQAMDDMDLKDEAKKEKPEGEDDDERQLYDAALNEAAELVWQHQNPGKVPQPGAPYRYKPHLRKNSYAHARTASAGLYGDDVAPSGLARDPGSRSVSGSSTDSGGFTTRSRSSFGSRRTSGEQARQSLDGQRQRQTSGESRPSKSYGSLSGSSQQPKSGRRRSSLKRDVSGEVQKPFSGDQIWEEPEGQTPEKSRGPAGTDTVQALRIKKSPFNRVQFASDVGSGSASQPPAPPAQKLHKTEIYRNPPTQSRDPQYITNTPSTAPAPPDPAVPRKHGIEVRGDDIRQATSMKLKDRSAKLPTPSAVSDTPGRPIVSFDKNWKPLEEAADKKPAIEEPAKLGRGPPGSNSPFARRGGAGRILAQHQPEQQQRQQPWQEAQVPAIAVSKASPAAPPSAASRPQPTPPSISVNAPPIPSISVSDDTGRAAPPIPTIVLPGDEDGDEDSDQNIPVIVTPDDDGPGIPVIVTPDDNSGSASRRPLPKPQAKGPHARHSPAPPRGHWSPAPVPAGNRATARCHECGHVIEGRFVSLRGSTERFHPRCFACYTCGTSLEALEISPEPDAHRAVRLERIARRAAGEILPETPGETMAEDGDERLRFYCHLDWHELFAPRCKHCTTPILGEHIVALGEHWHYGHFFCAECGDPFEQGMTHIEKDGYAWCVRCQTKRTERRAPKCRKCRTAVIGQYVQALGGEWHDECFRCATCGGGFDDGQIFPMEGRGAPDETVVLCTGCRMAELKA